MTRPEIKAFLRARRRALLPEAVGLPRGRNRRIAGLRREELALLAGVGVTWYTWLEQGRDIRVSSDTLQRIARALQLSPSDTQYLFALCELPAPPSAPPSIASQISQPVLDVLESFQGLAIIIGPTTEVLAANRFTEAVYDFDAFDGPWSRNLLARSVLDPKRRHFYVNFDDGLRNVVGFFRVTYARHAGEAPFESLLATLLAESPDFVRVWNEQQTALPGPALPLSIVSERFGRVNVHSVRFLLPDLPDHLLVLGTCADQSTQQIVDRWWRAHRDGQNDLDQAGPR
jgi:transcriptional regulator with XRE-family HTH domain